MIWMCVLAISGMHNVNCREKLWTIAGAEFGPEDKGKVMIIARALYRLKSSGADYQGRMD